ncbi:MAG: hypothetical protein WBD27_06885 [Pyrinomonadaceae bacterium]
MKCRILLLIGIILVSYIALNAQDLKWMKKIKQVRLFSHSYDDVIRIMGKPIDGSDQRELSEYFDIDEGRVFVEFASGLCVVTPYSEGKPIGWKVPEWTAISMSFTPNKPFNPRKLTFDTSGFRKYPVSDVPGAFVYENDEIGIDFSVTRKGKVGNVGFYPSSKFDHLRCTE